MLSMTVSGYRHISARMKHAARSVQPLSVVSVFRVRKQGAHTTPWQSRLEASPAPAAAGRKALCTHDAAKGPWPPSEDPESFYETSALSAHAEASKTPSHSAKEGIRQGNSANALRNTSAKHCNNSGGLGEVSRSRDRHLGNNAVRNMMATL